MATSKPAATLADINKSATPSTVTVPLCVAGKLIDEHARLTAELEDLQLSRIGSAKLSDPDAAARDAEEDRLRKRIRKLEVDIKAQTHDFVFVKLEKNGWRDLRSGRCCRRRWGRPGNTRASRMGAL